MNKVSVIIPVYKVEKYIHRCVDSVLNQTYRNLEIILVDDGSPDNCPTICDEYASLHSNVRVIHKENGGLSDARNAGIDVAEGDFITFIDSDDYVEKNYVEVLLNNMLKDHADISCCKHLAVYGDRIVKEYTGNYYVLDTEKALEMMLYHDDMDVSAWGKLYRKELFDGIRFPVGRYYEDAATTYRLIDRANVIVLDSRPLYNYIMRDDSITNDAFSDRKMDLIKSTEEMTSFIKWKYPELTQACDRRLLYSYLSTLTQTLKDKDVDKKTTDMLVSYVKKNGHVVLNDKKAPMRDKIAIISAGLGYGVFRFCWNTYSFFRGSKAR